MFNFAVSRESLLSGFQWFFFIFATRLWFLLRYFLLFSCRKVACLPFTQYAFLATALACFAQAFCGHRRAIMEGPWPVVGEPSLLSPFGEASRGTPINDIATSGGGDCTLRRADGVDWF